MSRMASHTRLLWRCVAEVGEPVTQAELARRTRAPQVCAAAHVQMITALNNLVACGYLASNGTRGSARTFWFGQHCRTPTGELPLAPWLPPVDASRAAPRQMPMQGLWLPTTIPLRPGAEDWRRHPSRVGDHLHHRDGRITRLNADNTETLVREADDAA